MSLFPDYFGRVYLWWLYILNITVITALHSNHHTWIYCGQILIIHLIVDSLPGCPSSFAYLFRSHNGLVQGAVLGSHTSAPIHRAGNLGECAHQHNYRAFTDNHRNWISNAEFIEYMWALAECTCRLNNLLYIQKTLHGKLLHFNLHRIKVVCRATKHIFKPIKL